MIPELPLGMLLPFAILTLPDIFHTICSLLKDDRSTLYSLALSSRLLSKVALPILYANITEFPGTAFWDLPGVFELETEELKAQVSKWMSLWRSLALSALDSNSTTMNYASLIRCLDLDDLDSLGGEVWAGGPTRRQAELQAEFFAGGLEDVHKGYIALSPFPRESNFSLVLADIVLSGTRNLRKLVYVHSLLPEFHLNTSTAGIGYIYRWLTNLPLLEDLQVPLRDLYRSEKASEAIKSCPSLTSLQIEGKDESLWFQDTSILNGRFFSWISEKGLEKLEIDLGVEWVDKGAVDELARCHGNTLTSLTVACQDSNRFLTALSGASQIVNLRSCNLSTSSPPIVVELEHLGQFLGRNKSLEHLSLGFEDKLEPILRLALPCLHLINLSIDVSDSDNHRLLDSLMSPISSQSSSLESFNLQLPSDLGYEFDVTTAIRSLSKLKHLTIHSHFLSDQDVKGIVSGCQNLETVEFNCPKLTNLALKWLSSLPHLTNFTSSHYPP
jgi:hypothetical protein